MVFDFTPNRRFDTPIVLFWMNDSYLFGFRGELNPPTIDRPLRADYRWKTPARTRRF